MFGFEKNSGNADNLERSMARAETALDQLEAVYNGDFDEKGVEEELQRSSQLKSLIKDGWSEIGDGNLDNATTALFSKISLANRSGVVIPANCANASVNSETAGNGFDPILAMYSAMSDVMFEANTKLFGDKYTIENGNLKVEEADIPDYITKKGLKPGANPFARLTVGMDKNMMSLNINGKEQYISDDPTDSTGIAREKFTFGDRRALVECNFRVGFFLDRDLMQELGYQRVSAADYIKEAIDNAGRKLNILTAQQLIYDEFLVSNKFTTAGSRYNHCLDMIYTSHSTPKSLSKQDTNEFIASVDNLIGLINGMRADSNRYSVGVAQDSEILLLLDENTVRGNSDTNDKGLLGPLKNELVNASGFITPTAAQSKLLYLLSQCQQRAGKVSVITVKGATYTDQQGNKTYFKLNVPNGKKLNWLCFKDCHKYVELMEPSVYADTGLTGGLGALQDFKNYTKTSPITATSLVFTNNSHVFTSSMKYAGNNYDYCMRFEIPE